MSPLVERFSFPKNLTRGKRLRVICTVTEGDLPLEVEWWKDGLKIEEAFGKFQGVQVRRIDEYTSLLAISFLETTHAGNYSCVAKNSVASFARSATLTIRGKWGFFVYISGWMGSVFVVISGCCGDTSGKKQRVIIVKKTSLLPSKSWQVATSPQTQIYAWGIDPKVRFSPLFLARVKEENEVSSQEKQLSAKQQSPIKVSNQLLQQQPRSYCVSLVLLHTSPLL